MIFPGHLSAGYLTTYATLGIAATAGLSTSETVTLLVAGTLLGDAPDVDILFYFFRKKTLGPSKLAAHRKYITHAPILWLTLGLSIFFAATFAGAGLFWQILGLLVWLCPWSHFICDSVDCGIMWLWPFSKKQFALYNSQDELDAHHVPNPSNWRQLFLGYLRQPLAYLEIAVSLVAVSLVILSL